MIVSATFRCFVANIENLADFRVLDGELAEKDQAFSELRAKSMRKFMVWRFFAYGGVYCAELDNKGEILPILECAIFIDFSWSAADAFRRSGGVLRSLYRRIRVRRFLGILRLWRFAGVSLRRGGGRGFAGRREGGCRHRNLWCRRGRRCRGYRRGWRRW